jgi:hypothetical protein
VERTGAEFVFGPADGGLFALHGAIGLDRIRKVAAYEPLLMTGHPDDAEFRRLFGHMHALIRSGRSGEGVLYSATAVSERAARQGTFPTWLAAATRAVPAGPAGRVLDRLLRLGRPRDGRVPMRDLLVALPPELDLVLATEGTLDEYGRLDADVLLMHGGRTDPIFVNTARALHGVLPRSTVLELPGLDHDSAQTYGRPAAIAAALRGFFTA